MEKEAIREIYRKKGFQGDDLELVVRTITSNRQVWVDTLMVEELGIFAEEDRSPIHAALITFASFFFIGMVPLAAYILAYFFPGILPRAFDITVALTAITIFSMGAGKSQLTGMPWFRSGMEMLFVGGMAAAVAYWIGHVLKEFKFEETLT